MSSEESCGLLSRSRVEERQDEAAERALGGDAADQPLRASAAGTVVHLCRAVEDGVAALDDGTGHDWNLRPLIRASSDRRGRRTAAIRVSGSALIGAEPLRMRAISVAGSPVVISSWRSKVTRACR
jgi:hypothetical protein